jgi:hypothetical protein
VPDPAATAARAALERHGRAVARAGLIVFALGLANGFLIEALPLPRLARAAHLVALIGAALLIGLAAWWPRLAMSAGRSRLLGSLAVCGLGGAWLVYFAAAALGAGGMFPQAAGGAPGSPAVENAVSAAMLAVAVALFAACAVAFCALGRPPRESGSAE